MNAASPEQNKARNEAYHLIKIAHRILSDADLGAYAEGAKALCETMKVDAAAAREREMGRILGNA